MRSDILRKIKQARTFECLPKDKAGGMLVHLPKNCRISESSVRRSIRPVYPVACTVLSDGAHCRILCPLHPIRHQNRCVVCCLYFRNCIAAHFLTPYTLPSHVVQLRSTLCFSDRAVLIRNMSCTRRTPSCRPVCSGEKRISPRPRRCLGAVRRN